MKTTKNMCKRFVLIISGSLLAISMYAQFGQPTPLPEPPHVRAEREAAEKPDFTRHELSLWISGGYSSLFYKPTVGERNIFGFGGNAGLGYSIFFSKNWGLMLGAELMCYNAHYSLDYFVNDGKLVEIDLYHPSNPLFQFYYQSELKDYAEQQTLVNLNIPLMLQFQPTIFGDHKFFIGLGAKFGLPLMGYHVTDPQSKLKAWGYSLTHQQPLWKPKEVGFGEFKCNDKKSNLDFGYSYTAFAELGFKWRLGSRSYLYTGFYVDYTFNDVLKKSGHDKAFLEWGQSIPVNDDRISTNSILNSSYTQNNEENPFTDKVFPLSFGLKLRLGIDLSKKVSKTAKELKEDEKAKSNKTAGKTQCCDSIRIFVDYGKDGKESKNNRNSYEEQANPEDVARNARAGNRARNNPYNSPYDNTYNPYDNPYNLYNPYDNPYDNGVLRAAEEKERKRADTEYNNPSDVITLYMDTYDVNQDKLSLIMKKMIDDKIPQLRPYNNASYTIVCEGHTCSLGKTDYNLNLGKRRAEEVKKYLITKGFNPENIASVSKGETLPLMPNISEINRRVNRRVVFIIKENY